MSRQFCILCVLSKNNAHASIRYVGACMLDCYDDELVDEESVIKNADPIAIKFELASDSYPIETDLILDDLSTFTDFLRACHAAFRL